MNGRRPAVLLLAACLASAAMVAAPAQAQPSVKHDVIVTLRAQADPESVSREGSQRVTHRRVLEHLKDTANTAQRPVRRALDRLRRNGDVGDVTSLWISNSLVVSASDRAVSVLRSMPQVLSVTPDATIIQAPIAQTSSTPEPNVIQVGAPSLWDQGLHGQGVVVAMLDSGADLSHPDIAASYRGGPNSWFDPYGQHTTSPVDFSGHGTWTTGVVVGGSTGGTAIGVAPAATWIAARVFNDAGSGSVSAIHEALQWAVDPDGDPTTDDGADVINNSWSLGTPGCNLVLQPDLAALRALDVLPVFAAGNAGPGASTSYSPANYPEALSVGSVDASDVVLYDSSRGPSSCGGRSRVFPDVTAPGKNIRTSDRYGIWTSVSGTSLAAPHATGVVALLLSGDHSLTASEQEAALLAGARDLGAAGDDNSYGAGRIDALASWNLIATRADSTGPVMSDVAVTPNPTDLSPAPVVQALADDTATGGSAVVAAEAFVDSSGPSGTGLPLTLGSPGSVTTTVSSSLPTNLTDGAHTVFVRAKDAAGNWGPLASAGFQVATSDLIFADGFESGSTSRWSRSFGGSRLTTTTSGVPVGNVALRTTLAGAKKSYVQDDSPSSETTYRAGFWFDPQGTRTSNSGHDVLAGWTGSGSRIFRVKYRLTSQGSDAAPCHVCSLGRLRPDSVDDRQRRAAPDRAGMERCRRGVHPADDRRRAARISLGSVQLKPAAGIRPDGAERRPVLKHVGRGDLRRLHLKLASCVRRSEGYRPHFVGRNGGVGVVQWFSP